MVQEREGEREKEKFCFESLSHSSVIHWFITQVLKRYVCLYLSSIPTRFTSDSLIHYPLDWKIILSSSHLNPSVKVIHGFITHLTVWDYCHLHSWVPQLFISDSLIHYSITWKILLSSPQLNPSTVHCDWFITHLARRHARQNLDGSGFSYPWPNLQEAWLLMTLVSQIMNHQIGDLRHSNYGSRIWPNV